MSQQRIPNLRSIPQFEREFEAFKGRMRWLRWRSQPVRRSRRGKGGDETVEELPPNGFADAFCEVAGRLYVDVDRFFKIVAEQNRRGGDAA